MFFDYVLKNAKIVDGSGAPWFKGDVGIDRGVISAVGKLPETVRAKEEIDLSGKILCPGFIDIHTHSDFLLLRDSLILSKLRQGVTTQGIGQCGLSPAPLSDDKIELLDRYLGFIKAGVQPEWSWRTFGDWLDVLESLDLGTNIAAFVGHGTVRIAVMGFEDRGASDEEIRKMRDLVESSVEDGAFGLSSGLIYAPGVYSSPDEIAQVCMGLKDKNALYESHMRNESADVVAATQEIIDLARKDGISVQISHHKALGRSNWGLVRETLEKVDRARSEDIDVTLNQYPYTSCSTTLRAILPPWVQEGGVDSVISRLEDQSLRERIKEEVNGVSSWENMFRHAGGSSGTRVLYSPVTPELEGLTLLEIGAKLHKDPVDAAFDVITANNGADNASYDSMSEEDVKFVMKHRAVMIASDSIPPAEGAKTHPRTCGTNPRVLGKYVREEKVLSMEEAVWKMSGFPAWRLGLQKKGLIREGMDADLVVFDPETVVDMATFEDPERGPEGIEYVFVNGVKSIERGVYTGKRAGRVLRK